MEGQQESLICPNCASHWGRVIETREIRWKGVFFKMRTRECFHCGTRYRTKEVTDDSIVYSDRPPSLIKKPKPAANEAEVEKAINEPQPAPTPLQENVDRPIPDNTEELLKEAKKGRGRPRKKKVETPPDDIEQPLSGDDFFPPL